MSAAWTKIATRSELARKRVLSVRCHGRQIAIFDSDKGVFACNNRCPHEGYPLSEGAVDEACVLTCNWHNWKFDLSNGDNLYGGDRLRTYPVEIRADEVWIDLSDAPFEQRRASILANLHEAFDDNDYQRTARELGRLRLLDADTLDAARAAILWSHDRLQFGWTHGYAGLADWLSLRDRYPEDDEVLLACLLEGISHIADDVLREPSYPYATGVADYDENAFVDAVEREDEASAIRLLRGGLDSGLNFATLEPALARAALAHYNAFGHSVIYLTKAKRLIQRLGDDVAQPLLLALVRQIVFARREDLIPEFRAYALAAQRFGTESEGQEPSMQAWRGLGIEKALDEAVRVSRAPPGVMFDALLGANAYNLLCYDIARQGKVRVALSDNIGWLDFTHPVTFGAAAKELCERHPQLWPSALLQLCCFSGRNARYTVDESELGNWSVADPQAFFAAEVERLLDHDLDEFIVSVHRLKTLLAVQELCAGELSTGTRATLLCGVRRYLHSPTRLKHVRRTVHQAMQFVAKDG